VYCVLVQRIKTDNRDTTKRYFYG